MGLKGVGAALALIVVTTISEALAAENCNNPASYWADSRSIASQQLELSPYLKIFPKNEDAYWFYVRLDQIRDSLFIFGSLVSVETIYAPKSGGGLTTGETDMLRQVRRDALEFRILNVIDLARKELAEQSLFLKEPFVRARLGDIDDQLKRVFVKYSGCLSDF